MFAGLSLSHNVNTRPIVFVQKFDNNLANVDVNTFINNFLINTLRAKYFVCGDNFRFAKNGSGTITDLQNNGLNVHRVIKHNGVKISSTLIKKYISEGSIELANAMSYKNIYYNSYVTRGLGIAGTKLGFKTANLVFDSKKIFTPKFGVYACKVLIGKGVDCKSYKAICNIGKKPTINYKADNDIFFIEVNIFDFNYDIYGVKIKVELVKFLREEKKFINLDSLKKQINLDIELCKSIDF
jgi:riboflavin kinase/FMN adenylyltransferase